MLIQELPTIFSRFFLFIWSGSLFFVLLTYWLQIRYSILKSKESKFRKKWGPLFASYSLGIFSDIPKLSHSNFDLFVRFWNHYQQSFRGDASLNLNQLIDKLQIQKKILKNLHSWSLKRKLDSIIALGHLQEINAQMTLQTLSQSKNPVISLSAFHSLIQINPSQALPAFLTALPQHPEWPEVIVGSILKRLGAKLISPALLNAVRMVAEPHKAALIRYLGLCSPEIVAPVIYQMLRDSNHPQTLEYSLKNLVFPLEQDVLDRLVKHPEYLVRKEAFSAIGRTGGSQDETKLIDGMADPKWDVRYQSAVSLVQLLDTSREKLHKILDSLTSNTAIKTFKHVLSEKQLI